MRTWRSLPASCYCRDDGKDWTNAERAYSNCRKKYQAFDSVIATAVITQQDILNIILESILISSARTGMPLRLNGQEAIEDFKNLVKHFQILRIGCRNIQSYMCQMDMTSDISLKVLNALRIWPSIIIYEQLWLQQCNLSFKKLPFLPKRFPDIRKKADPLPYRRCSLRTIWFHWIPF